MIPKKFKNTRVLVILEGCGSGSKLLQNYLDNHNELLMMPGYNLMYFYPHWFELNKKNLSLSDLIDNLIKKHPALFNRDNNIKIDKKEFKKRLIEFLSFEELSSKNFLIAMHLAYSKCLNQSIKKKKILVYHLHLNSYLKFLEKDFKNIFVIYMIRSIEKNLSRRVKYGLDEPNDKKYNFTDAKLVNLKSYIEIIYLFSSFIYFNNFKKKKRIFLVSHESLLEDKSRKRIFKKICSFLKINLSKELNKATVNGKNWKILPNPKNKEKKYFNHERIWMECLFNNFNLKLYPQKKVKKLSIGMWVKSLFVIFLPSRIEIINLFKFINLKNFFVYIKKITKETKSLKFYNYEFNSFYKHKWTNRLVPVRLFNIINSLNNFSFPGKFLYFVIKLSYIIFGILLIILLYFVRVFFCLSLLFFLIFNKKDFPQKI